MTVAPSSKKVRKKSHLQWQSFLVQQSKWSCIHFRLNLIVSNRLSKLQVWLHGRQEAANDKKSKRTVSALLSAGLGRENGTNKHTQSWIVHVVKFVFAHG